MDKSTQFILSILVIVLGYCLKRVDIVSEDDAGALTRVILNVTLPAVVLNSFLSFSFEAHYLFLSSIVIAYSIIMYIIGRLMMCGNGSDDASLLRISLLGFNIGLFAYPLIETIWGSRALGLAVFVDVGNALVIFGLAYVICIVDQGRKTGSHAVLGRVEIVRNIARRLFTFIPFISFLVALALSVLAVRPGAAVTSTLSFLAGANGPLVLLLLGITFTLDVSRKDVSYIARILIIRYAVGTIAGIICYCLLPYDQLTRVVLLVCLLLPAGMAIIPYSIEFGYKRNVASAIVNISNIISLGILAFIAVLLG